VFPFSCVKASTLFPQLSLLFLENSCTQRAEVRSCSSRACSGISRLLLRVEALAHTRPQFQRRLVLHSQCDFLRAEAWANLLAQIFPVDPRNPKIEILILDGFFL